MNSFNCVGRRGCNLTWQLCEFDPSSAKASPEERGWWFSTLIYLRQPQGKEMPRSSASSHAKANANTHSHDLIVWEKYEQTAFRTRGLLRTFAFRSSDRKDLRNSKWVAEENLSYESRSLMYWCKMTYQDISDYLQMEL